MKLPRWQFAAVVGWAMPTATRSPPHTEPHLGMGGLRVRYREADIVIALQEVARHKMNARNKEETVKVKFLRIMLIPSEPMDGTRFAQKQRTGLRLRLMAPIPGGGFMDSTLDRAGGWLAHPASALLKLAFLKEVAE